MGNLTYRDSGVDTKEGERAVRLMGEHVKKTFNANVLTGLGSFGGLFSLPMEGINEPVLVSGTDGVGTKLKIAFLMDRHDTVGIDCVAMCVNDVLCHGAMPLFFLDYIATGKVVAEKIAEIVKGIADGCVQGESALIGGETAEMPGFYSDGEYDIAGFSVGIVDRKNIITGAEITCNQVIIGLPSSGMHSNGYSLARKLLLEKKGINLGDYVEALGETLGEALLRPTKIYVGACKAIVPKFHVKGIVHITGGGFYENVPRVLPEGVRAEFRVGSWQIPPIFKYIMDRGEISQDEMFATFNMGVGMMFFVEKEEAEEVVTVLKEAGETPYIIGKTGRYRQKEGEKGKVIIDGRA